MRKPCKRLVDGEPIRIVHEPGAVGRGRIERALDALRRVGLNVKIIIVKQDGRLG